MRLKASIVFLLLSALALRAQSAPRLVVLVVVDQMRADYVDRFQADWNSGLKRLVSKGAWFQRAAYPYLDTVTCAGHATIGTGAFPVRHGIFQNSWFDRAANAVVTCTGDATAKPVAYGKTVAGSESAARLWCRPSPTKCGGSVRRTSSACRSRPGAPS
jgi:predicted AlkP superfamily pyrophosphatase or phosphodiesterase